MAAVAIIVAVVALVSGSTTTSPRVLNAPGFTTEYPEGWSLSTKPTGYGVKVYAVGSTRGKINGLGIPAPGEIGLTMSAFPASAVAILAGPAAGQGPLQLLPRITGVPRGAENLVVVTPLHEATLGGAPAAAVTYQYVYDGIPDTQSDVVARHRSVIAQIELDAEPSLASSGDAALAQVVAHWRWSTATLPTTAVASATRTAIENVVRSLITALKSRDFTAACSDYTPSVQAEVITAARHLPGATANSCPSGLATIYRSSPKLGKAYGLLGAPRFSGLFVAGNTAHLAYSSTVSPSRTAHSDIAVIRTSGHWKIDRATSLTFSNR